MRIRRIVDAQRLGTERTVHAEASDRRFIPRSAATGQSRALLVQAAPMARELQLRQLPR